MSRAPQRQARSFPSCFLAAMPSALPSKGHSCASSAALSWHTASSLSCASRSVPAPEPALKQHPPQAGQSNRRPWNPSSQSSSGDSPMGIPHSGHTPRSKSSTVSLWPQTRQIFMMGHSVLFRRFHLCVRLFPSRSSWNDSCFQVQGRVYSLGHVPISKCPSRIPWRRDDKIFRHDQSNSPKTVRPWGAKT